MIRHQNADSTMVLASVLMGGIPPWMPVILNIIKGVKQAHWLGPWCQHSDDELRLRQNHEEVGASV